MANEISITTSGTLRNGLLNATMPAKTTLFSQTTARGGGPGVVDVGTSQESISFGDIVPGFVRITNLDTTNFVEYGNATGNLGFIAPANGGVGLVHMKSGQTLYVKADTAACKVLVEAFNT